MTARFVQVGNGLGSWNVADEMIGRAFWDALPRGVPLDVELLASGRLPSDPYPERHRYVPLDEGGRPLPEPRDGPALLVGEPPLAEARGFDWALRFVGPRLDAFHRAGLPVDAVGVEVGLPGSPAARETFRRSFLPIRSWSVRSSRGREVLRELGVPAEGVVVGADWSWLYRPRRERHEWAAETWRGLGLEPSAPLVVASVTAEEARGPSRVAHGLAEALDRLVAEHGFQVAFFAADIGEDVTPAGKGAEQVIGLMRQRGVRALDLHSSPDELLGLLAHATATVSSRYHFIVSSVMAGTVPVLLPGRAALEDLAEDLDLESPGPVHEIDPRHIVAAVVTRDRARTVALLQGARRRLETRAANNLALWGGGAGPTAEARGRAAIVERMSSMLWYHRIELAPGVVTPGQPWDAMWEPMRSRHREVDFRGKAVLEVGCWDGYWSFEAERLGAAEVWATDDLSQRRAVTRTVPFAIECLRSKARYLDDVSVYDVDERLGRTFDVVIFYGVLYHLRYPALALAKLRRVLAPGGLLLLETVVLPDVEEPMMRWGHRAVYPDDPSSWNAVSLACLRQLLETSYFEVEVCETFLRQGKGMGRGYARARAVARRDPDPHPVPDRFLAGIGQDAGRKSEVAQAGEAVLGRS